ncbi:kinase-like protein [Gigaspora margarita]|uniref:Kinase-like protein n=1 Tax=Gigaspora margarita TaxID=4874 RepID=A0A8H4A7P7_GIGMA|nr:kinase-like protein [Gigaspora margarita]
MSSTKNNKSRYRDGCIGPGYRALKNSFLGNLFRKLTFKSGRSQETTNNSSLTNSDLTNSIINYNNFDTKIQTPQKIKIKSNHNQSLKIHDSVIDNLKNNENNNKKDYINESENIAEKNFDLLTQNVNIQTFNNINSNSKNSTKKIYNYIHYCHKCGHQKLHNEWCEQCDREIFESDFPNWTSGNELKSHLISNDQVVGRFNILRTYGITRDPNSKVYMMVMTLADDGDLSAYMKKHFSTLTFVKRLNILYDIATEFKRGDELLKTTQLQTLHPNNVPYSTYHDTKDNDNEDSTFDISDSLYKVADSLDYIDLDELSIMHSVNIEDIKKRKCT